MKHLPLGLALAAVLSTGCIHTTNTTTKDEARVPIEFENDTAGRIFYEALSRIPDSNGRDESESEVSLPVVFSHKQKTVRGPNLGFNSAVRRCDTNQDGRITEVEARIFNGSVP